MTITIPDAQLARVLDAVAIRNNYNPLTDGTKAQFVKAIVIRNLIADIRAYEVGNAQVSAGVTADAAVTTQITLT